MTPSEYDEWERHHKVAFPGFGEWLSKQDEETSYVWAQALRDVPLEQAKAATLLLVSGDEREPEGFSKTPAVIRGIALRLLREKNRDRSARRYVIDGQPTIACLGCQDVGVRIVWHPRSIRA